MPGGLRHPALFPAQDLPDTRPRPRRKSGRGQGRRRVQGYPGLGLRDLLRHRAGLGGPHPGERTAGDGRRRDGQEDQYPRLGGGEPDLAARHLRLRQRQRYVLPSHSPPQYHTRIVAPLPNVSG